MTPAPETLAAIHRAAFSFPRPWSADEIAGLLADPLCFLIHRPEGFALGRAVAGEAELLTIAVRPAAQGRGVGRALMEALITEARNRSAERIFLEVAATNESAVRLYERSGFVRSGLRRGYFSDGTARIDAIVMVHNLAASAD